MAETVEANNDQPAAPITHLTRSPTWATTTQPAGPQRERPAGRPASTIRPASSGIGRDSSAEAEAVSDALRRGGDQLLARRRRTAALSLLSIGSLGVVATYQNGLLRLVAALASVASVPQTLPDAAAALRRR